MASSSHRQESLLLRGPWRRSASDWGPRGLEQRVVQFLSGDNGSFPESSAFMEDERDKNYIFDIFGKILMLVLFIYLFGICIYVCICLCEDHRGGLDAPLPLCALNPWGMLFSWSFYSSGWAGVQPAAILTSLCGACTMGPHSALYITGIWTQVLVQLIYFDPLIHLPSPQFDYFVKK